MDPIFPVELFAQILDHLAERSPGTPFDQSQIAALRSCSLVCRIFSKHCQLLLFERIDDFKVDACCAQSQLSRLQEVFDSNRFNLVEHVHELSIVFDSCEPIPDPEMSEANPVPPPYNMLLRFPHISHLSVKSAQDVRGRLESLLRDMIRSYVAQHTLHSLILDVIPTELNDVMASTYLKSLTLGMMSFSRSFGLSIIMNKSITHLRLQGVLLGLGHDGFLDKFAGLEVLDLCETFASGQLMSRNDSVFTSRRIREINIEARCAGIYLDLLRDVNKEHLTKIHIPLGGEETWTMLRSILEDMHSLRELNLTVLTRCHVVQGDTRFLELVGQDIKTSQYPLTCFTLNVEACPPMLKYRDLMCHILSFIDALSHPTNVLATLAIEIFVTLTTPQWPTLELWTDLSERLANPIIFPALRAVDVRIKCYIKDAYVKAELLERFGGGEDMSAVLSRKMRKITERGGLRLNVKITL